MLSVKVGVPTHPASGLEHLEVQRVPRDLSLDLGERVAGGHARHELGLHQALLVGVLLRQQKTNAAQWRRQQFTMGADISLSVCTISKLIMGRQSERSGKVCV